MLLARNSCSWFLVQVEMHVPALVRELVAPATAPAAADSAINPSPGIVYSLSVSHRPPAKLHSTLLFQRQRAAAPQSNLLRFAPEPGPSRLPDGGPSRLPAGCDDLDTDLL